MGTSVTPAARPIVTCGAIMRTCSNTAIKPCATAGSISFPRRAKLPRRLPRLSPLTGGEAHLLSAHQVVEYSSTNSESIGRDAHLYVVGFIMVRVIGHRCVLNIETGRHQVRDIRA